MFEELYLMTRVAMHRVEEGPGATPERIRRRLTAALEKWGGRHLEGVRVSGSYAKGTAIRGTTLHPADVDVDLFLSLRPEAPGTLDNHQLTLAQAVREFQPRVGNVSVKALVDNVRVDLTVGRRAAESGDHVLWQQRRKTWIRTNVGEQIRQVRESGRKYEIMATKIWRRRQALYFPSFCLELAVMEALGAGVAEKGLGARMTRVLRYLAEELPAAALRDPANRSNVVSGVMTEEEKWRVSNAAWVSLGAERWEEVI